MAKADGGGPVVNGLQRVQVFSIATPPPDTPKDNRPGPAGQDDVPAWLRTWSVALPDIDVQLLRIDLGS